MRPFLGERELAEILKKFQTHNEPLFYFGIVKSQ